MKTLGRLFLFAAIAICASGQTAFTVLHQFTGGTDGSKPYGTPVVSSGILYGTTHMGGTGLHGTLWSYDLTLQSFAVLYPFGALGLFDANYPYSGVVAQGDQLYGTTFGGGANQVGCIYVYSQGSLNIIYNFSDVRGGPGETGFEPYGPVIFGSDGYLYGTTTYGALLNHGTAYRVAKDGSGYQVVMTFEEFTGGYTKGSLVEMNGVYYGTSGQVVFDVQEPSGKFGAINGPGQQMTAGLITDNAGSLYGTTYGQGVSNSFGEVFQINLKTKAVTALHAFSGTDGAYPTAALYRDSSGNLFGTTSMGGASNLGTVFEISSTGTFSTLYSFTGPTDGALPWAGLTMDSSGNLYGVTVSGGQYGFGTLFEISGL